MNKMIATQGPSPNKYYIFNRSKLNANIKSPIHFERNLRSKIEALQTNEDRMAFLNQFNTSSSDDDYTLIVVRLRDEISYAIHLNFDEGDLRYDDDLKTPLMEANKMAHRGRYLYPTSCSDSKLKLTNFFKNLFSNSKIDKDKRLLLLSFLALYNDPDIKDIANDLIKIIQKIPSS